MRMALAVLVSVVLGPAVPVAVFAVMMIPFLFDAPGTADRAAMWALAGAVLAMPVCLALAIAGAWVAVRPGRSRWWYAGLLLPAACGLAFYVAGSLQPGFF